MKISNDKIQFDSDDIAAFSEQLQKDIAFRAGDAIPHEYLSGRFNAVIEECAIQSEKNLTEQQAAVALAVARADKATQNSVKTILGLEVSPEDALQAQADAEKNQTLWKKLTSLFS